MNPRDGPSTSRGDRYICEYMSRVTIKLSLGFPTRSDTNQDVQLQKMARG